MERFYALSDTYGKWVGIVFTAFVIGLLLYLHLFAATSVEKTRKWVGGKDLYVCEAPAWVKKDLNGALQLVAPWVTFDTIIQAPGLCGTVDGVTVACAYDGRPSTCAPGHVLLTLMDQVYDLDHGDETLYTLQSRNSNILKNVTILFPPVLDPPVGVDYDPPADLGVLVIAHALLHAEGYDHVVSELPGPFAAEPTGHIAASSIPKLGRNTEGL